MDDGEFLRLCNVPEDQITAKITLGVRRAIARLGDVPPSLIYPGDSFRRDLSALPFWSSLDAVQFLCALEEEFGVELTDDEAEQIKVPDWMPPTYRVKDMVRITVALKNLRQGIKVPTR